MSVQRMRLTGKAARFLQIAQDFGHLDEADVTELLLAFQPGRGANAHVIDLQAVRRAVATTLAEDIDGAAPAGILAEDWPLLFS